MCTLFSSIKAFVKTIALRARANIIFHTFKILSLFMTQRSTVDKYFKPRNSNNSRLVFICINSYINPCVIFWHRSDLRNGVGWSLLPKIWLTINAVKEKLAISGKTDETHERVRKTDERVRADPDPEFTCICNKSYHQRDRIHFPAISHTVKCRSPVPDALYTVYRVCTDISRR